VRQGPQGIDELRLGRPGRQVDHDLTGSPPRPRRLDRLQGLPELRRVHNELAGGVAAEGAKRALRGVELDERHPCGVPGGAAATRQRQRQTRGHVAGVRPPGIALVGGDQRDPGQRLPREDLAGIGERAHPGDRRRATPQDLRELPTVPHEGLGAGCGADGHRRHRGGRLGEMGEEQLPRALKGHDPRRAPAGVQLHRSLQQQGHSVDRCAGRVRISQLDPRAALQQQVLAGPTDPLEERVAAEQLPRLRNGLAGVLAERPVPGIEWRVGPAELREPVPANSPEDEAWLLGGVDRVHPDFEPGARAPVALGRPVEVDEAARAEDVDRRGVAPAGPVGLGAKPHHPDGALLDEQQVVACVRDIPASRSGARAFGRRVQLPRPEGRFERLPGAAGLAAGQQGMVGGSEGVAVRQRHHREAGEGGDGGRPEGVLRRIIVRRRCAGRAQRARATATRGSAPLASNV